MKKWAEKAFGALMENFKNKKGTKVELEQFPED